MPLPLLSLLPLLSRWNSANTLSINAAANLLAISFPQLGKVFASGNYIGIIILGKQSAKVSLLNLELQLVKL